MKKLNSSVVVLLVLLLLFVVPFAAVATADESTDDAQAENISSDGEDGDEIKPWEQTKDILEQEKDAIEELKDQTEDQIKMLEKQLKAVEKKEDSELGEGLKAQIEELKLERNAYKEQMKQKIKSMHEVMKQKYTQEELNELDLLSQELETLEGIKAIPVTNVLVKNRDIKFDTPPVIKEGRILIPVRALSKALGASIQWNAEEKTITLIKDDKEIVLKIDDNKILVNDVEMAIDVPAQLINNRTVVPLRFIVENLELQADWDAETETVEIE